MPRGVGSRRLAQPKRWAFVLLLLIGVLGVAAIYFYVSTSNASKTATINENLDYSKAFNVSADSVNLDTEITGTMFVYKNSGNTRDIMIVASFQVDPADWGGVNFAFRPGLEVTAIDCSYPQSGGTAEGDSDHGQGGVEVLHGDDTSTLVDVALGDYDLPLPSGHYGRVPSGGGTGTIVIHATVPENQFESGDDMSFVVEVGCEGIGTIYPSYITVQIDR